MGEEESNKWEGETTVELKLRPEQAWPLISDFCAVQKLLPHVEKCYLVEGVEGEVGMVRYCESSRLFPGGDIQWAKERLLMIDPSLMCLSYGILDNNIGFHYYVCTLRLYPINGDNDDDDAHHHGSRCVGCKLVWSFVADPIQGFTYQSMCEFVTGMAQSMAKKIEEEVFSHS